jgi:hypothetical protein
MEAKMITAEEAKQKVESVRQKARDYQARMKLLRAVAQKQPAASAADTLLNKVGFRPCLE